MKDSRSFVYKALSKELYVVKIYLRTYNDQPDFEISEPEAVCVALLGFVSPLVHNQGAAVLDDQDILKITKGNCRYRGHFELGKIFIQDDPQPLHVLWESAVPALSNGCIKCWTND